LADITLLAITAILLSITTGAAIEYYRMIRRAQFEYEKARDLVEEIVLSFNRELKRDTEKLDSTTYKIESNSTKIETALKKIESVEKSLSPIDTKMTEVTKDSKRVAEAATETNARMQGIEAEHENLKVVLVGIKEQLDKLSAVPEIRIESVIPIKRDKAMAALTDTEIAVLEMLAAEGAKTAPEIKERVQLSREHTARLMKKLYEEGYLERETDKIPFKYNVKKEMERFLKKTENPQA
jgi:predicted transcriptional regulator/copper chaperone CopZ